MVVFARDIQFIYIKSAKVEWIHSHAINLIGVLKAVECFPLIVSLFLVYHELRTLAKSDEGELLEAYHKRMCEIVD